MKNNENKKTYEQIPIPANIGNFESYNNSHSTHLHAFSEFIDNSIASYLKTNNNNLAGLTFVIGIMPNSSIKDKVEQTIFVIHNSGGMDLPTIKSAIIPDNRSSKKAMIVCKNIV